MKQEQLVERLKQDDVTALQEIMDCYTAYLCTVAGNLAASLLTAEDIEEVVSDCFVRLWTHRKSLDPKLSLKGNLVRTTRNLAVDVLRSRKTNCLPLLEEITQSEDTVETSLEHKEMLRRLKKHLEELSPSEQDILIRFYYYNQRTCKIAQDYGIQHNTLRTRLSRLRAELKKKLEGEDRQ